MSQALSLVGIWVIDYSHFLSGPYTQAHRQRRCVCGELPSGRTGAAGIGLQRTGGPQPWSTAWATKNWRPATLVYCSVSAYGHTGPDSARAGFGLIAQAKSGIILMIGSPGEAPRRGLNHILETLAQIGARAVGKAIHVRSLMVVAPISESSLGSPWATFNWCSR